MTARAAPAKARTARRNKGARRKARITPGTKRRSPSAAGLQKQLQAHTRELDEAHQQQDAAAEVLRIIASSPGELDPVFNTILENGIRLCEASFGNLFLHDGDAFRVVAMRGPTTAYRAWYEREPVLRLIDIADTPLARIARSKTIVHISDLKDEQAYRDRNPRLVAMAESAGARTILGVPLLKEDNLIGAIFIYRQEVRPFTDNQIALVKHFASQAVVAIENARLLNEIQDKSRQLAEASQHKSQFLANMSHELRTPLNAILGYTELILDNVYGDTPEKMRGVLRRIEGNGKHLLGLINDVLDLSKIEAGQLVLALGDYSLRNVVHTVFSAVEPLAQEKKLALRVELAPDIPGGRGDERRLTQVLLNLVGNAIKFTDAGEVVVTASAADGSFNVCVRDTGPGISERDQAKLFQEFQQADNSTTRKKGGTGLGLAISRRIIEMHGGRIWLESREGQGSTFAFTLPIIAAQQAKQ